MQHRPSTVYPSPASVRRLFKWSVKSPIRPLALHLIQAQNLGKGGYGREVPCSSLRACIPAGACLSHRSLPGPDGTRRSGPHQSSLFGRNGETHACTRIQVMALPLSGKDGTPHPWLGRGQLDMASKPAVRVRLGQQPPAGERESWS